MYHLWKTKKSNLSWLVLERIEISSMTKKRCLEWLGHVVQRTEESLTGHVLTAAPSSWKKNLPPTGGQIKLWQKFFFNPKTGSIDIFDLRLAAGYIPLTQIPLLILIIQSISTLTIQIQKLLNLKKALIQIWTSDKAMR
jgi:hypothetical protein